MIRFLTWLRSLLFSVLNAIAKMAVFVVLVFVALLVFGLAYGDGLPGNMVLRWTCANRSTIPARPPPASSPPSAPR